VNFRPSRPRRSGTPHLIVVSAGLDAHAYRQLRSAELARIREVGDRVALGRPEGAQRAFAWAIAINQELHVGGERKR
jgi:hypothetical protein